MIMKSMHNSKRSNSAKTRKLAVGAVLSIMGVLAGCCASAPHGTDTGRGGSGGGGGADGSNCGWDGTGGGVSIPDDCSDYRGSIHFIGTLDGNPVDELWMNNPTAVDTIAADEISHALDVVLPEGYLHLWWTGLTTKGEWIDVGGELLWIAGTSVRSVKEGSRIRLKCGASLFQYILVVDGGELTACSVN